MIDLGSVFVISLLSVLVLCIILLCRNEISERRSQASLPFKGLSRHFEKEDAAQRKLQKTKRAYIKERLREREHLNKEISALDSLLKEESIDDSTYARYKKLLEMSYQRKRQQTREKYGFIKDLTLTG